MNLLEKPKLDWRKIPGLPDRYEASSSGVIRVLDYERQCVRKSGKTYTMRVEGRYLTSYTRPKGKSKGHPVVSLSPGNGDVLRSGEVRVALLIARAFHGCPYEPGDLSGGQKWRVRHIDGDILNVAADNLEWVGNNGPFVVQPQSLYAENLRKWEAQRDEPVEDWIRRIWGEDAA